jgi:Ca-activated chloride channel family protein
LRLLAAVLLVTSLAMAQQDQTPTLKVDVKLVSVFVNVTDASGAIVTTLKKDDFELKEDGVAQKISLFDQESEVPLQIVLALDTSGSVRKDLRVELDAAQKFINGLLRPVDSISLYQFNEIVSEVVPFTSSLKRVETGLRRIRVGAGTAMFDAVYLGSKALKDREGRKVMVVITDGGDTVSSTSFHDAVRAAQFAEAMVYSIIVVPVEASAGRNTGGEHALMGLSDDTGGRFFYASDAGELEKAFEAISRELRTQYLLGYYPVARMAESDFRKIDVEVKDHPDYHVRHRSGYYTSKFE